MQSYTLQACENFINKYVNDFGGQVTILEEGTLGLGTVILHDAPGKKAVIIKEFFINAWSSGHKVRQYNKLPKKYAQLI